MSSTETNTTLDTLKITDAIYLIMQIGIEDGIGPSVATHRWILTRAPKSGNMMISYKEKPHGAPYLEDKVTRTLKLADHGAELERLQELLAELPTQYPGAEDMYGRNTSIVHVTDYVRLHELDRSGRAAGLGVPQPTEEQKAKFDEAVAIISKWSA